MSKRNKEEHKGQYQCEVCGKWVSFLYWNFKRQKWECWECHKQHKNDLQEGGLSQDDTLYHF